MKRVAIWMILCAPELLNKGNYHFFSITWTRNTFHCAKACHHTSAMALQSTGKTNRINRKSRFSRRNNYHQCEANTFWSLKFWNGNTSLRWMRDHTVSKRWPPVKHLSNRNWDDFSERVRYMLWNFPWLFFQLDLWCVPWNTIEIRSIEACKYL